MCDGGQYCVRHVRSVLCACMYDTRPFPVSAHVRRRLEKLRHLASVRLTCMQIGLAFLDMLVFILGTFLSTASVIVITYDFPYSIHIFAIEFFLPVYSFHLFLHCLVITPHILVSDLFDIIKAIIAHAMKCDHNMVAQPKGRFAGYILYHAESGSIPLRNWIFLLIPSPIPELELNWNWLYPVQAELELNWNCHHLNWNWSRNCVLRN